MLLGFQSQAGQAGVASVPVHVGRGRGRVGTRRGGHPRVERRVTEVVQVIEAVEAGARHASDRRRHHAGRHGGYGVGRREHGLRGQRVDVHGVEEREAFGGQRGRRQALGGPVVVRVARVHVFVGLHESVELRAEAVLAQLGLLVPLAFPPLGSSVLEPNLQGRGNTSRLAMKGFIFKHYQFIGNRARVALITQMPMPRLDICVKHYSGIFIPPPRRQIPLCMRCYLSRIHTGLPHTS